MTAISNKKSLHDLLQEKPNIANFLYNDTLGPHGRTRGGLSPVPAEFSNWREEQRAWRETAVLFDQTHHMPELWIEGPDALKVLNYVGINSLANLRPGRAKQFVGCNERGQYIGDCILHDLGNDRYELISGMPLLNWVEYQALKGGHDVTITRESPTSPSSTKPRTNFRFGMDGPNAGKIFADAVDGDAPEIPFFNTAQVTIDGCEVLALRHGMAGHKGVEMSGRLEDGPRVRAAILKAGEKYRLRLGGMKAYYSTVNESGWIGYPLPAIYTGQDLEEYRKWLPADSWEAQFQIAGSFYSDNIEDYYLTPHDLGYGRIINFDHDFIGKAALQEMADKPHLTKVTLAWNHEDVTKVFASLMGKDVPYRYIEMPVSDYGLPQRDRVETLDGNLIGYSTFGGYSANEGEFLSLAMVDGEHARAGTDVILVWGEPDGGSRKPQVEPHRQLNIRATIGPVPYAKFVQESKRATL